MNLLESLIDEPGLNGVRPRLPALRLSRINAINHHLDLSNQPLRITSQPTFRVMQAITGRVRYSKTGNVVGKHTMVASLDVETANSCDRDIVLQQVKMQLMEGSVEDIGSELKPLLPLRCRPRDFLTFLFRLSRSHSLSDQVNQASYPNSLDITIHANVLVSEVCQPRIEMRWRTGVDFSTSFNASFSVPNQPLQRTKRPANIAISQTMPNEFGTSGPRQLREGEGLNRGEEPLPTNDLGVSMSFTAPNEVYVGEPFSLDCFVVNRSSQPRKLAVLVIPRRKRPGGKTHLSKPSTASSKARNDGGVADAVTDESLLYAMQRNSTKDEMQIVSLSNDTIIG